jgi:hypothetical protein
MPREAEAGGLQIQGQPGLHSETLFQKHKQKYLNIISLTLKSNNQ